MIKILTKVNSSMIYAVGYDEKKEILEVVFMKGSIWGYEGVPKDIYEDLLDSDSIGSYMNSMIFNCYNEYQIN